MVGAERRCALSSELYATEAELNLSNFVQVLIGTRNDIRDKYWNCRARSDEVNQLSAFSHHK